MRGFPLDLGVRKRLKVLYSIKGKPERGGRKK